MGVRVGSMEEIKETQKILYHFVVFAIINELLITKNRLKKSYKPGLLPNASARRDTAA